MPGPTNAPDPNQLLQKPKGQPGVVPGSSGTSAPLKNFDPSMVYPPSSNSSNANNTSGVGDLEYGSQGYPFTTRSADSQSNGYTTPSIQTPTNQFPWAASGQLFMTFPNGNYVCSASLIKPGLVVTAAHCISNYGTTTVATNIQFVPGRFDNYAPYGVWTVSNVVYPSVYRSGTDTCDPNAVGVVCANDMAVLVLNPDSSGKYAGTYIGYLGYSWNGYSFSSTFKSGTLTGEITQLGYPCLFDSCTRMVRTDGPAITAAYNQFQLGSAQTGGSSGGPWTLNFGANFSAPNVIPGTGAMPNVVTGVTSWGYNDQTLKVQGAAQFGNNAAYPNNPNIVELVNIACNNVPSGVRTNICGPGF